MAHEITFRFADGAEAYRFIRYLTFGKEMGLVPQTLVLIYDGQNVVLRQGPEVIGETSQESPAEAWIDTHGQDLAVFQGRWDTSLKTGHRIALIRELQRLTPRTWRLDLSKIETIDAWGMDVLVDTIRRSRGWVSDPARSALYEPLRKALVASGYPPSAESTENEPQKGTGDSPGVRVGSF